MFAELWRRGLVAYDERKGIDWEWLAMDGAMTKAPLGGGRTGPNPTDRAKRGRSAALLTEGRGIPIGIADEGANRNDHLLARPTLESIPIKRPEADPEASAGPLPRRRLRQQRDPRAHPRVRLHRAHPLTRRREESARP